MVIVLLPIPINLDLYKPLVLLVASLYMLLNTKDIHSVFLKTKSWLLFLFFCAISLCWSFSISLSLPSVVVIAACIAWMMGLNGIPHDQKNKLYRFAQYGALVLLGYFSLIVIWFGLVPTDEWNSYFGMNANAVAVMSTCLLPISFESKRLFRPPWVRKTLILIVTCVVVFICLWANSIWAIIVAGVYLVAYFVTNWKIIMAIVLSGIVFLVVVMFIGKLSFLNSTSVQSRIWMAEESIKLWRPNLLFGTGLNTWEVMASNYDSSVLGVNAELFIQPGLNHNIYTSLLVEIGLLGLLFYLIAVVNELRVCVKKGGPKFVGVIGFLICYFLCGLSYNNIYSDDINFSEVQFVFFTIVGLTSTIRTNHLIEE